MARPVSEAFFAVRAATVDINKDRVVRRSRWQASADDRAPRSDDHCDLRRALAAFVRRKGGLSASVLLGAGTSSCTPQPHHQPTHIRGWHLVVQRRLTALRLPGRPWVLRTHRPNMSWRENQTFKSVWPRAQRLLTSSLQHSCYKRRLSKSKNNHRARRCGDEEQVALVATLPHHHTLFASTMWFGYMHLRPPCAASNATSSIPLSVIHSR